MAPKLLLFFILFVAMAFFRPTWRLWRRGRVNALVLPRDDSVEGFVGRWFRAVVAGIFLLLAAMSLGLLPAAPAPLPWLELPATRTAGWIVLVLSLLWVMAAQARMGSSWRIGIDGASRPPLVRTGVFAISRNPIFLGMRGSLLGLVLVLPNAFTLAILVAGDILIQVQVRLREEHLSAAHAHDYERYTTTVRRWI